ncbi:MAG: hypothetical protein ABI772_02440 [Bacteroidota bacterium]
MTANPQGNPLKGKTENESQDYYSVGSNIRFSICLAFSDKVFH